MTKEEKKLDMIEFLLRANKRGTERAIDNSIRTGVPLVVEKNGKITYIEPKYKYVKVPIKPSRRKSVI